MIINKIRKFVADNALFDKGDTVLVGLSGGADSVCLTHALHTLKKQLGIEVYTAHVNHGIRGEEANRDAEFARLFSEFLGIKYYTVNLNIPKIAQKNGISEETAGRIARYDFFRKISEEHNITKIATAHNLNDNAETLLMNFMRGSTIKGMSGIPLKRGNIVRPILGLTRAEIEQYCAENNLGYVTDSTNSETLYTRNKIRHILLPLIESEFNPSFVTTSAENSVLTAQDSAYIDKQTEIAFNCVVKNGIAGINELKTLDNAILRRVITRMINAAAETSDDIRSIYVHDVIGLLDKNSGASVNLPRDVIARTEYGRLVVSKAVKEAKPFEYALKEGATIIPELRKSVIVGRANTRDKEDAIYISAGLCDRLTIRNRREGDVFMPYGMNGSKKVKEYFINNKIPRAERTFVPIICVNGTIAAVGKRVDRRFLFSDNGVKIEFKPLQEV